MHGKTSSSSPTALAFLAGGETGALMRARDWSTSPLGDPASWPQSLRSVVGLLLSSKFPMFVAWGEELGFLYNDSYAEILGAKHPQALGARFRDIWAEIWPEISPLVSAALAGEASYQEDLPLIVNRRGFDEQAWFTFSYSPVHGESGQVAGMYCVVVETTGKVLAERRLASEGERQRQLFEQAPGFITILSGPEHVFEFVNNAYRRLFGERDFVGKSVRDAFPELAGQGFFELIDQVYRTGERFVAHHVPIRLHLTPGAEPEDRFLDFIYEPVTAEDGRVTGIFCEGHDVTEAHNAQEASRASERELQLLTDALPVLVSYMDADVRYRFVNRIYEEWFPRRRSDIVGKLVRDVVGEEAYANVQRWIDAALAGQRVTFEQFMPYKEGQPRHIRVEYVPRVAASGQVEGFYSLVQDVTEHKAAEAELRASEARLRDLNADLERQIIKRSQVRGLSWQVSPDLMGALNPAGYFETSNPAWQTMLGWSEAEVAGMSIFEMLHPDDLQRTRAGFELTQQGQPAIGFPNRYRCKDGTYRWISWVGVPEDGMVYCTGRDITAEKEQEAALAERTADWNRMWHLSTDVMLVARFDATITSVNPAWTNLLGWLEDELVGKNFMDLVHPDDQARTLAEVGNLARGIAAPRFENRYRRKDGSYRWVSWIAVPDDDLIHAVGRDITAEKEAAEVLRQTEEQLRQAQKMEAVGQLTGGVAHDFNNLLTIIKSSTDLLRRQDLAEERRRRYVDAIADTVERAAKLTSQLLAFARRQALKPEAFDVADRIRAVADMLRTIVGSRIQIVTEVPSERCFVEADVSQFETALVNMVVNARDAMDGEGMLTVKVRQVVGLPAIRLHAGSIGAFVSVSLSDTGAGIPADKLGQIFEPFFTTKEVGKGTGLGLSQVYGFAKQSGGDVAVESKVGHGTTFTLYLPQAERGAMGTKPHDRAPALGDVGGGRRVLVVEDNVDVGTFSTQLLQDLGYETTWAGNADEALKLLQERADRFDVVFSDVVMPGMGGVELGQEIRRRYPSLPVILTSGYSDVLAEEGRHGFELLQKPYAVEDLSRVLRRVSRSRAPNSW
jgi:PAS domain S-box-containing protein